MPSELLPRSTSTIDGPAYWFNNGLYVVIATSESTGGAFSMVHETAPPGNATPYHLHYVEDEAFFVLDGEFTFNCDRKKTILGPGGYIFLPRNIPHGFDAAVLLPPQCLFWQCQVLDLWE
jgi:quercetin dioxygenase-like cupin family protein